VRGDTSGDLDVATFLQLARNVFRTRLAATDCGRELVLERVNTPGAERFELRLALFDQRIRFFYTLIQPQTAYGWKTDMRNFEAVRLNGRRVILVKRI